MCLVAVLGALPQAAPGQDDQPPPGRTRSLAVPRTGTAPVIDGELDDDVWTNAAVATGFWISEQGRRPTEKTEVLVLADGESLYIGFRCFDSSPDAIQALQTRRDADLGFDDQVAVELDPFHDHRTISTYSVNARGTQSDAIAGGRARKIEWKGDWRAAVARTDYGWSAEIAIPFGILNYRADDRVFGVNFLRHRHRTDEWSRWADVTPQGRPEEMGQLEGLDLPRAGKRRPMTWMPYALGGRKIPDKEGKIHDFLGTAGLDIRYEPFQNVTGVLSLNPDFSQLETQVTSIDFSYTEKFRLDPRPFFQEGSAYFGSDTLYFYSNRVPDFDYGGKIFAQLGRYQVGALATLAPDDRQDLAIRLARELDPTNSVGVMLVATDREDLANQLVVGQLHGRQPFGLNYDLDVAASSTQEQEFDDGVAVRGALGWRWDYVLVGAGADRYDVNFFPADGLMKDDLIGTQGIKPYVSYFREFAGGPVRAVDASITWSGRDTTEGLTQTRIWSGGGSVELRQQQVKLGAFYSDGLYRPVGGGRGQWSDTLNHDHYWIVTLDLNTRSDRLGYGASYSWGFLGGGDYAFLRPYLWAKPTNRTFVDLSTERLDSFGTFDQTIVSAGWDITDQDGVVTRYILANDTNALRVAYRRQVRAGVDVFVVYDEEPGAEARVSLKLVWTFR